MEQSTQCLKCASVNTYFDGTLWNCTECFHAWTAADAQKAQAETSEEVIKDAHGQILQDGDSVTIIKDLKVKGASGPIKVGTKVKNIRLQPDGPDGHNISCRVDGFGSMNLKSEFVKKA